MFDKEEEKKKFRVVCNSEREGEGVNIKEDAFKVILLQNQHLHKLRLCQYINQTRMFVSVVSVVSVVWCTELLVAFNNNM